MTQWEVTDLYDASGHTHSWKRMDEGPKLNSIGRLCRLLALLDIESTREVFAGTAPAPKWFRDDNVY